MAKALRIALIVALAVALLVGVATAAPGAAPQANAATGDDPYEDVKNVILFISDGAGEEHFELGRGLNGDWLAVTDKIPWQGEGTLDTSSLDGVTDSAAAGTALATGCETYNHWLSMVGDDEEHAVSVETVLERALSKDKWAGLVTDVGINDATPAAFAAHVTDRYSVEIPEQMRDHHIQMLFGSQGWPKARPLLNLSGVTYIKSSKDLAPYFSGAKTWVVPMYGLIGGAAMTFDLDREEEGVEGVQPTLPEMTDAALHDLSQNGNGFFLMVEGGAIDWGAHARDPGWVGTDVIEFDQAVEVAYDFARDRDDTLLVVTSDHETGGLLVDNTTDYTAIAGQKATTEYIWGLIKAGRIGIEEALRSYMGVVNPTEKEIALVAKYGQMGISDVLSARDRDNVTWAWSGKDDGEHTLTPVPIRAWGPGADRFDVTQKDNEYVGTELMEAVSN